MRNVLVLPALLLAAVIACSCMPVPGGPLPMTAAERGVYREVAPELDAAFTALGAEDWKAATGRLDAALARLPEDEAWRGLRQRTHYNRACALARQGQDLDGAVEAFAAALAGGLGPVQEPSPAGWVETPGPSLVHILADRDLEAIRERPGYRMALAPYLRARDRVTGATGRPGGASSIAIVLAPADVTAQTELERWEPARPDAAAVALTVLSGPIRERRHARGWLLADGDERWGLEALSEALLAVEPGRRAYLIATTPDAGAVAWRAAFEHPDRVAGIAAPGGRYHAEFHADVLVQVAQSWKDGAKPWPVVLTPSDRSARDALAAAGADLRTVTAPRDPAKLLAALLD